LEGPMKTTNCVSKVGVAKKIKKKGMRENIKNMKGKKQRGGGGKQKGGGSGTMGKNMQYVHKGGQSSGWYQGGGRGKIVDL